LLAVRRPFSQLPPDRLLFGSSDFFQGDTKDVQQHVSARDTGHSNAAVVGACAWFRAVVVFAADCPPIEDSIALVTLDRNALGMLFVFVVGPTDRQRNTDLCLRVVPHDSFVLSNVDWSKGNSFWLYPSVFTGTAIAAASDDFVRANVFDGRGAIGFAGGFVGIAIAIAITITA